MKRVIITVGPPGSGKTTFCQKIVASRPDIVLVERDRILIHYCGSALVNSSDPVKRAKAENAYREMWYLVMKALEKPDATVIVDCFNSNLDDRKYISEQLSVIGAERIEAWIFITSHDQCGQWFSQRETKTKSCLARLWEHIVGRKKALAKRMHLQYFMELYGDKFQWCDGTKFVDPLITTVEEALQLPVSSQDNVD